MLSQHSEDVLIKHPDFALPGRKALLKSDIEYDVILIDATIHPDINALTDSAYLGLQKLHAKTQMPKKKSKKKPLTKEDKKNNAKLYSFHLKVAISAGMSIYV